MVTRGQPDLIEIKGVTYCGESKASPLTIKHCPFHHEVRVGWVWAGVSRGLEEGARCVKGGGGEGRSPG